MKFIDGQSKFLRVFNFAILRYSRNSHKLGAREKLVFYKIPHCTLYNDMLYKLTDFTYLP